MSVLRLTGTGVKQTTENAPLRISWTFKEAHTSITIPAQPCSSGRAIFWSEVVVRRVSFSRATRSS